MRLTTIGNERLPYKSEKKCDIKMCLKYYPGNYIKLDKFKRLKEIYEKQRI